MKDMICSVFNWDELNYTYYRIPGVGASVGGWKPLTGLGVSEKTNTGNSHPVGIDIEDALPSLPSNAVKVGTGIQAVGQVAIIRDNSRVGSTDNLPVNDTGQCSGDAIATLLLGIGVGVASRDKPIVAAAAIATSLFLAGVDHGKNGTK